jgi:hypothetical protein
VFGSEFFDQIVDSFAFLFGNFLALLRSLVSEFSGGVDATDHLQHRLATALRASASVKKPGRVSFRCRPWNRYRTIHDLRPVGNRTSRRPWFAPSGISVRTATLSALYLGRAVSTVLAVSGLVPMILPS